MCNCFSKNLGFTKVGRDIIAGGTTSDVLAYLGVPDLLKGKQDADNTLTALARLAGAANKLPYFSGPDVMSMTDFSDIGRAIIAASTKSSVLSYLELGSAAKKNTGTDADQIPDMSSFAFGSRWITLPSGHIIQFDVLTAGVGDKANWPVTNYPIPFPNELLLPPVAIHTGNGAVDTSVNFIVDTEASLTRFLAGTNGLTPQNGAYIAIGR
ncbi:phage tail protein [Salmonella enterica]|nr:phage tail protein [Salmonella enterica]